MVDYRVDKGDTYELDYSVKNTGESAGDQDIKLLIDSSQEDVDNSVVVDVGVTETGTLTWDTSGQTAQQYTAKVESADSSATSTLEVVDPTGTDFYLADIDSTNAPVNENETLDVTATAENVGDQSGTQTLTLKIDGSSEDTASVSLGADATATETLSWTPGDGDAGDKTVRVESADDFDETTATVETGSQFAVTIDSTNSPVVEGNRLDVNATIDNTGDADATQSITLDIDGGIGTVDTKTVTLTANESKTRTFEWNTSDGDAQSSAYTATVSSDDDTDTASVDVNEEPTDSTGVTNDWTHTLHSDGPNALDIGGGRVYTCDQNGTVISVAQSDGSKNFETTPNNNTQANDIHYAGSLVYIGDGDGNAFALDESSGSQDWSHDFNDFVNYVYGISNSVYCAGSNPPISLVEKPGDNQSNDTVWKIDSTPKTDRALAEDSGTLYSGFSEDIISRDGSDGTKLTQWNNHSDNVTSLVYDNGHLYSAAVGSDDSVVKQDTGGAFKWRHTHGGTPTGLAVANGVVYSGDSNGDLVAADASDGSKIWKESVHSDTIVGVGVVNNRVYTASIASNEVKGADLSF